jgi:hypothetical protein
MPSIIYWFLKPLLLVASGLVPPPPIPTARAPSALDFGSAPDGFPWLEVLPGFLSEGLRASDLRPLSVTSSTLAAL